MTSKTLETIVRRAGISGACATALIMGGAALDAVGDGAFGVLGTAHAAQGEGHGGEGARRGGGGAGQGAHGEGKGAWGGRTLDEVIHGEDEEEDSDRPDWAGGGGKPGTGQPAGAGSKRGDLYGDLWVILRDENGVPVLDDNGYVQPILADGTVIQLTEDGELPTEYEDQVQEVELGRLNVGRSPSSVLDRRTSEVIANLNAAEEIYLDPAGRLVFVIDGVAKTVDSPLENLALYVSLISDGSIEGVSFSGDLAHLSDGKLTEADYQSAASLLAAAADKSGTITIDMIAYYAAILGLEGDINGPDGNTYIDYSGFDYDRSDLYGDMTVTVLIKQDDGSYEAEEVNVLEAIFGGQDFEDDGGIASFTQAADDARAVINYIHEYEIPADSLDDVSH